MTLMPDKKDRDRFSIKFNLSDPLHMAAVELLEQQGPRRKAQFVANAVLHYANCPETPQINLERQVDRTYVENIVLEIMKQQDLSGPPPIIDEKMSTSANVSKNNSMQYNVVVNDTNESPEVSVSSGMDEATKALIADTMQLFRSN